jgi:hypothetical protein
MRSFAVLLAVTVMIGCSAQTITTSDVLPWAPDHGTAPPKTPIQIGVASVGLAVDVDSIRWDHTIPDAGTGQRLLLVTTGVRGDPEVTSVTYGTAALTFLRRDRTAIPDARTEIWYLVNPPTGAQSIVIQWNKKQNVSGGATSWIGIDDSNPFVGTGAGAVISAPTTSTEIAVNVPSVSSGCIVDVVTVQTPNAKLRIGAGQTERWHLSNEHLESHSSSMTSAGAVTRMQWTQTGTGISGIFEPYAMSAVCMRYAGPE